MNAREFSTRIVNARSPYTNDSWWSGTCPAHDDDTPSLGWIDGTVKIGIKCQAGCTREEVLAALGLTENDTWLRPRPTGPVIVAEYDYRDEVGALLYQSVRYEPKTFRQRRPDPDRPGKWISNVSGARLVLYRLNELRGQRRVVIVEGEKDADRLAATGLAATCNPMGAGKWRKEYAEQLVAAGCLFVTVIPDSDEAGRKHAEQVMQSCVAAGLVVQVVTLSEEIDGARRWLGDKEDVSDYLDRNSVDDLYEVLFSTGSLPVDYRSDRVTSWPDDMSRLGATVSSDAVLAATLPELTSILRLDALLGPPPTPYPNGVVGAPETLEQIVITGGPRDMQQYWNVLVATNTPPTVFLYGDLLFMMETDAKMQTMNTDRLRLRLCKKATWLKLTKQDDLVEVRPALQDLNMMLVDDETIRARMPNLERVVRAPVFSKDGRLVQAPGYDRESGIYYQQSDRLRVPAVALSPTDDDLARARDWLLKEVFVDFPFVEMADWAAVMAFVVLPFARDLIDGPTPLHVISASKAGTGKSLLYKVVTTIATGRIIGGLTDSGDEQETRKRITARLIEDPTFVCFENMNTMLSGSAIAQAITGEEWTDRRLGVTEMVNVPIRCVWVAVANNPEFSGEVGDRTVTMRQVSPLENPRSRDVSTLRHKGEAALLKWVGDNRGDLVWSCLTLVQNWISRGSRPGSLNYGSFQQWAEVMSGILEAAGIEGLLENRRRMLEITDLAGDARKQFVILWRDECAERTVSQAELIKAATMTGLIDNARYSGASVAQRLGKILRDLADQAFLMTDGVTVAVTRGDPPRDQNGLRWRLRVVKP
jgi:5S rRNA maturation endonuclease (ribonuclease M5)